MALKNYYVSVIVPVYNRAKDIHRCISALFSQTYPKDMFEIIIVDDYSTDNLKEEVSGYKNVKYVLNELEFGLPAARNMGLKEAKGNIIIFLDDDAIPENDYIQNVVKIFQTHESVGGVTGKLKNVAVQEIKKGILGRIMKHYARFFGISGFFVNLDGVGEILSTGFTTSNFEKVDKIMEVRWLSGCNMSYSRETVEKTGLFDNKYSGHAYHEDADFSYRAYKKGYKLYATPHALVEHLVSPASRKKLSAIKYYQLINNNRFFLKNVYEGDKVKYLKHILAHLSLMLPVFAYSVYERHPAMLISYLSAEKTVLSRIITGLKG